MFYGNNLDVYCAIQSLISLGIEPPRIVIVFPNTQAGSVSGCIRASIFLHSKVLQKLENLKDAEKNVFSNNYVEKMVKDYLNRVQIEIYSGYYLKKWQTKSSNLIDSIIIQSENDDNQRQLSFECDVSSRVLYHLVNLKFEARYFLDSAFFLLLQKKRRLQHFHR